MTKYTGYHDSGPAAPILPAALTYARGHRDDTDLAQQLRRKWPQLDVAILVHLVRGHRPYWQSNGNGYFSLRWRVRGG